MARAKSFAGFSKKMPAFFRGLARNNTREWFTPRKELFEAEVRGPMVELVSLVNEDLKRFALDYTLADPRRAIYRIYRDTRFSKDKTPYKTHTGATFHRQGLTRTTCAGFYFGVSHEHVEVAGGVYMPGPDELSAIRRAIAEDGRTLLKLLKSKGLTRTAGPLQGEKLRRPPKGFDDAPPDLAELLRHKQWYFYVTLKPELSLTPRIRREVVRRFEAIADVLNWFNAPLLRALEDGADEPRPKRPEPMW
jgi:uncharacterized protein (TIGR02453 family)